MRKLKFSYPLIVLYNRKVMLIFYYIKYCTQIHVINLPQNKFTERQRERHKFSKFYVFLICSRRTFPDINYFLLIFFRYHL